MNRTDDIPQAIDNLKRVSRVISEYSRSADKLTGLTGPQLWAMKLLADEAPMMVSVLARRMYLHPATVVGILDRLELKGLVLRNRSRGDRRAVNLVLTEQGKDLVAKAPEVARAMLVKGLEALSDEEFFRVVGAIELVAQILGGEPASPQPVDAP